MSSPRLGKGPSEGGGVSCGPESTARSTLTPPLTEILLLRLVLLAGLKDLRLAAHTGAKRRREAPARSLREALRREAAAYGVAYLALQRVIPL